MIRRNGRYRAECHCRKCNHSWSVAVDVEYGIVNLINDDDMICPECGTEVEEIEICGLWD
jgi:Zn finger protein HypA/HybF involved in hydrogenase expression